MTTFCYFHPAIIRHLTGLCSESQERAIAVVNALRRLEGLHWQSPFPASTKYFLLAHTPKHVARVSQYVAPGQSINIEEDPLYPNGGEEEVTVLSHGSLMAMQRSVGGVLAAADAVMSGWAANAFCMTRPPAHHAFSDYAQGYCPINTIAIAALYLQKVYGVRVAIVDHDFHHGNGTQSIIEQHPDLSFFSIHSMRHWPYTGKPEDQGIHRNIHNITVDENPTREGWLKKWNEEIIPSLRQQTFDIILVSAGYDPHESDPLDGGFGLKTRDFYDITQSLLNVAMDKCGGRLICSLEGGYGPFLGQSAAAAAKAMMERTSPTFITAPPEHPLTFTRPHKRSKEGVYRPPNPFFSKISSHPAL